MNSKFLLSVMFGNTQVLSVLPVWPLFVIWTFLESRKRPSGLYFCLWRRCRASPCSQRGRGVSVWQPLGNGDAVQQGAELAAVENLGWREGRRERRQRSCLYGGGLSSSGKAHSSQAPGAASGVTGQFVLQSSADLPKRPVGFQHLCGFSLASFHCLFCWWPSVLLLSSVQWLSSMES